MSIDGWILEFEPVDDDFFVDQIDTSRMGLYGLPRDRALSCMTDEEVSDYEREATSLDQDQRESFEAGMSSTAEEIAINLDLIKGSMSLNKSPAIILDEFYVAIKKIRPLFEVDALPEPGPSVLVNSSWTQYQHEGDCFVVSSSEFTPHWIGNAVGKWLYHLTNPKSRDESEGNLALKEDLRTFVGHYCGLHANEDRNFPKECATTLELKAYEDLNPGSFERMLTTPFPRMHLAVESMYGRHRDFTKIVQDSPEEAAERIQYLTGYKIF